MSLSIKNLGFSYTNKKIIDNFSYDFKENSSYAIMAGSGKGKTTLLRLISGLEKKYSGKIEYSGKISYMFQENRLFDSINVIENIALVSSKSIAEKILGELGLTDIKESEINTLSGGMKRRVALARALSYNADIILLDEPLNGLDEKSKKQTVNVIKKYAEGKILIVVTHSESEANDLCENKIAL